MYPVQSVDERAVRYARRRRRWWVATAVLAVVVGLIYLPVIIVAVKVLVAVTIVVSIASVFINAFFWHFFPGRPWRGKGR